MSARNLILKILDRIFKVQYKRTYAQSGEDMVLSTILNRIQQGFYVDVGANNPIRQSNTQFFYERGWSGINIDALPGSMKAFKKLRPRDINLEIPVSDKIQILKYYMFSPSFYNSFSVENYNRHKDKLIETKDLQTEKLFNILERYAEGKAIDFMSVDVEGLDLQVLRSNDWHKYRPKVIVLESMPNDFSYETELHQFMQKIGYTKFCNTPTNVFYLEDQFLEDRFLSV